MILCPRQCDFRCSNRLVHKGNRPRWVLHLRNWRPRHGGTFWCPHWKSREECRNFCICRKLPRTNFGEKSGTRVWIPPGLRSYKCTVLTKPFWVFFGNWSIRWTFWPWLWGDASANCGCTNHSSQHRLCWNQIYESHDPQYKSFLYFCLINPKAWQIFRIWKYDSLLDQLPV